MNTRAEPRIVVGRASWLARVVFALWLLLPMAGAMAQALAPIPAMESPVVDTTGTLDAAARSQLSEQARELQRRKGSQLQILMVDSTAPETIDEYALRAFDAFELGRKDVADGVLVVVAKGDKRVRIEVGYGLEGAITDAQAATIISHYIGPRFREGDYAAGLRQAAVALAGLIDAEALPPPPPSSSQRAEPPEPLNWVGWRTVDTSWALAFVFALGMAAVGRALGWPRGLAWPLALLPPLLFAWMWSGPESVWDAAKFAAVGALIGHWLPRQRWLRMAMTGFALAVAIVVAIVVVWQGRAPNLLGLFYGLLLQLSAVPLLAAVVAPPVVAWNASRVGFAVRALLALALGGCGWNGIPAAQRGLDMTPGFNASSAIVFGVFAVFVWAFVFMFEPSLRGWGRSRAKASSLGHHRPSKSRKKRKKKPRKPGGRAGSGGSSGSGTFGSFDSGSGSRSGSSGSGSSGGSGGSDNWSGGGGRSGGGGASGSW